ncbi:hypothetical protein FB451DRAFT_1446208 [Mycena latifolia]|nr:hypothetical protein FB451DRAFT_1446208 [Mycena latifolia]
MTEYDYSPEAYQRHFETQARIARWAQATHQVPQKDPFAPPTPANGPAPLPREASRSSRRTRSSDRDRDRGRRRSPAPPLPLPRDGPPRSQTAPPQQLHPAVVQPSYYPAAPPPPPPQTQNQHRRARSSSQAPVAPPLQPTRSRSYAVVPHPHAAPTPARGMSYPPPTVNYPPLPPGYVYAQPQPQDAQPAPVYARYAQPQPMRSPSREVPLLTRMFGFGGGGSKGLSRESSRSREGSGWAQHRFTLHAAPVCPFLASSSGPPWHNRLLTFSIRRTCHPYPDCTPPPQRITLHRVSPPPLSADPLQSPNRYPRPYRGRRRRNVLLRVPTHLYILPPTYISPLLSSATSRDLQSHINSSTLHIPSYTHPRTYIALHIESTRLVGLVHNQAKDSDVVHGACPLSLFQNWAMMREAWVRLPASE